VLKSHKNLLAKLITEYHLMCLF